MTYNVFSGTLNPTQSINQSTGTSDFSVCAKKIEGTWSLTLSRSCSVGCK